MIRIFYSLLISTVFLNSCTQNQTTVALKPTPIPVVPIANTGIQRVIVGGALVINTNSTKPSDLVNYAETLTGTPYRYGSSDPKTGFDCSGFITYVFNHFNITVPRSSIDFTDVEREVRLKNARRGDLILFTGTDSTLRSVGHMGIITSAPGQPITFIHSTSGKAYSVTTTPLNPYYQGRFVKALRIFKQNESL